MKPPVGLFFSSSSQQFKPHAVMKQCYKDCNLITTVRNSQMMYCCCPLWHLPSFNGDKLPEKSSVGSECVAIINLLCLSKHFIMIIRWYLHEDRQRWHMISMHWRGTGCSASSQGRESSWETTGIGPVFGRVWSWGDFARSRISSKHSGMAVMWSPSVLHLTPLFCLLLIITIFEISSILVWYF